MSLSVDRRAFENKINSYPQFLSDVPFEGGTFKIHYIHKPSSKPNATPIPLLLLHGWPGSFVEFLGVINGLSENGFDVVAPSSPGYCFSQKTPVDKHMGLTEWTKLSDELMRGLGYEEYAVQAGDWAARVSASLGRHYPACKGPSRPAFLPRSSGLTIVRSRASERHFLAASTGGLRRQVAVRI